MKLNDIVNNEPIASILQLLSSEQPLHLVVARERLAVNNVVQQGKYITTHRLCDVDTLCSLDEFIRYDDEVLCATYHAITAENQSKLFNQRSSQCNDADAQLLRQLSTLVFRVSELQKDVYELVILRTPLTDVKLIGSSFIIASRNADSLYLI